MKLITLNVWGGKIHEPLIKFVEDHAADTEIFCFQEVFSTKTFPGFNNGAKMDLFQDLESKLPGHCRHFALKSKGYDYGGYIDQDVDFGNAIFAREHLKVESCCDAFEPITHPHHDWTKIAAGKAQAITLDINGKKLTVCNFHGVWIKNSFKKDTEERLRQSKQLKELLDGFEGEKILCGDFNLLPDGQSMAILEQGMKNLIKEYGIASTRSSLYKKDLGYADYILVTNGVKVRDFRVLPREVSDHLPLMLEFGL